RKAVALHPATPRQDALRCLDDLPWRDLMDIGRERRTPPPVRRVANQKLLERLPRLSSGEKASLARLADSEVLQGVLADEDPRVLAALLRNPRLTAANLVRWITTGEPDAKRIEVLAADPLFAERPEVRSALLACRATPRAVALSLLRAGNREDWRRVLDDPRSHPLLRACAEALLEETPELRVDKRRRPG
ncbi:MAG TPA: hypothetical protein VGR00_13885, partial [Thermoanaerobaculia bacterium]|nr:hypothetical protein [Thermoanaerobaculia bacterium]